LLLGSSVVEVVVESDKKSVKTKVSTGFKPIPLAPHLGGGS